MKRYYRSKYEYPTTIIKGDGRTKGSGGISIGHKKAQRDIESTLGRRLRDGTKIETRGGNWRFTEPSA